MSIRDWAEAMRLPHWIKSGFCLAAIFFHGSAADPGAWIHVLPVVLAFSLISSAGYLINDIANQEEDRHHPRKKDRPLASGRISRRAAGVAVVLLMAGCFAVVGAAYGWGAVLAVVGGYSLLSGMYSSCLRDLPVVDVLVLALGFVARVAAGAYALGSYDETAYPTVWLLVCTYFLALLLGFGKRKGEWLLLEEIHGTVGETRKALRGYSPRLLDVLTGCSALLAGGTYLAYCLERPDRFPFALTGIPAVAGLLSYLRLAWRSTVVETPERLFLHSPVLLASVAVWLAMVALFTAFS